MTATAAKPPEGRVQKRRNRTRAALMRSAYALMSTKGVDETTIQEITAKADVGFGTFYNYFASKDDLAAQILDRVIEALGRRSDVANRKAGITDPVVIVANSVRLVAREMMTEPMWRWWLKRTDLMVTRMREAFMPFGIRDMELAIGTGSYRIPDGDLDTAWSFLIWLLAGSITDIVEGHRPPETEAIMAESVLRVMGVELEHAKRAARMPLPPCDALEVEFH